MKTAFGAVGNGVADDSTPIQNALNALDNNSGIKAVVYLPAGTYRITRTLKQTFREGSSLIGHGRDTIISWDGPVGGTMFISDSNAFSNFEGITWRGNGRAATGVDHNSKQRRESRMLHRHEAFLDFTDIALKVSPNKPDQKYTEEVLYDNCLFRNARVGISLNRTTTTCTRSHHAPSTTWTSASTATSGRLSYATATSKEAGIRTSSSLAPRTVSPSDA